MTPFFKINFILLVTLFSTFLAAQEKAEEEIPCRGKIDLAPAYVHLDFLKSGVTRHRMDLAAVKAEVNIRFLNCLLLKPSFLYGHGHHKDRVCNGGVALGIYLPLAENVTLTPLVGINFGNAKTSYPLTVPVPNPLSPFAKISVVEKFYASSPYLGVELSYTFLPAWRIVLNYQYSWSQTHTRIKPLLKEKSHSQGSSYSALLEHDLNKCWSINLGAAYNVSLTKEKHGLRAYGCKLGIAYWF